MWPHSYNDDRDNAANRDIDRGSEMVAVNALSIHEYNELK
jgi:hypothetical protein